MLDYITDSVTLSTGLRKAIQISDINIATMLLNRAKGISLADILHSVWNSLEYAMLFGNVDIVESLLSYVNGFDKDNTISEQHYQRSLQAFQTACFICELPIVEMFLRLGYADFDLYLNQGIETSTFAKPGVLDRLFSLDFEVGFDGLERAVELGNCELVKRLVGAGVRFDGGDVDGLMKVAVRKGCWDIVKVLVDLGVGISRDDAEVVLEEVVGLRSGFRGGGVCGCGVEVLNCLIDGGFVDLTKSGVGDKLLRFACRNGDFEKVEVLLQGGVDIGGRFLIESSVQSRNLDLVKKMLTLGAGPITFEVLQTAIDIGDVKMIVMLVSGGVEFNATQKLGMDGEALLSAASRGDFRSSQVLVKAGVRLEGKSSYFY
ncbi:hypothetical protein HDU76_007639 [Blyttiomyces sp. JEL0837]|nr:hypothetical protein HDU76_007639 [Blyttiomyces sp. JEL0837]